MINKHSDDCDRSIFTLDQFIFYQIKIAGELSENWLDWIEMLHTRSETYPSGFVTTTLSGSFDQAALLGLLRRLYYLGYPLISVNCIQPNDKNKKEG